VDRLPDSVIKASGLDAVTMELLNEMQAAHDYDLAADCYDLATDCGTIGDWKRQMRYIAAKYDLSAEVLDR
jgi:hypothetical protein